jgi:UDP-GlcNAc:undecaprenyl-phosphate GlcNAc-1-phosphate transferase
MTTIWVTFIFAYFSSIIATRITVSLARRWKFLDQPDGLRKIHTAPTPRLGGVAIYVAFFFTLALAYFFRDLSQLAQRTILETCKFTGLLAGATILLVTGIYDDIHGLPARRKLFLQTVAAIVACLCGYNIPAITVPFVGSLEFGVFALPITVFWFLGCINAVNLIDGIDGLASGACVFVFMTLLLVGLNFGNTSAMLMGCASGATLGFLMFNFPPARIFLGDSGSMLLGFLVATLSLIGTSRKAEAAVALFIPIVALGLPIFDTAMAIFRRWYRRLPLSTPDRQHVHHILVSMGYSQKKSVLILYAICVALAAAALLVTVGGDETVTLVIGALFVLGFVAVRLFSGVKIRAALSKMAQDNFEKQNEMGARVLIQRISDQLIKSIDINDVWEISRSAFHGFGLDSAQMVLFSKDINGPRVILEWTSPTARQSDNTNDEWTSVLHLHGLKGEHLGYITFHRSNVFSKGLPAILSEFRHMLSLHLIRISNEGHGSSKM